MTPLYLTLAHDADIMPAVYRSIDAAYDPHAGAHAWVVEYPSAYKDKAHHALIRATLADFLHMEAANLRIAYLPSGKPILAPTHADYMISIAHAGTMLAFAISRSAIGIDIEFPNARIDHDAVAEQFFAAPQYAAFSALAGAAKQDFFYEQWTAREARFKAGSDARLVFTRQRYCIC